MRNPVKQAQSKLTTIIHKFKPKLENKQNSWVALYILAYLEDFFYTYKIELTIVNFPFNNS